MEGLDGRRAGGLAERAAVGGEPRYSVGKESMSVRYKTKEGSAGREEPLLVGVSRWVVTTTKIY